MLARETNIDRENASGNSAFGNRSLPSVVSYCATFLKPEMLHVYRQVVGVGSYRNLVVTRRLENASRFPHAHVYKLGKSPWRVFDRLWHRSRGSRIPVSWHESAQISRIIERTSAGVLHIYFGTEAARLLDWLPRAGVPIIVSFHGADVSDAVTDAELQGIFRHSALLLHRSESLRKALLERGAPDSKLRANPTGVPVPGEVTELEIGKGKPLRLLQACRFIEKKGLDVTLGAAKKLSDSGFDVHLTLAGDGPQRRDLEMIAENLGIASRVRFTGFLDSDQLAQEYSRHEVFLHPSRVTGRGDREGIPNSLLEAMAYGRVVVATRHSGIPEAVEDGRNGFLVDHADSDLVADAVSRIVSDPAGGLAIGRAARRTIIEKFSTEACIRQLEACYLEAISNG